MRILIGEFSHESNCFCAGPTRRADFEAHQFLVGDAVLEAHRGTRTVLGGFLDAAAAGAHDVIPTLSASCLPSGPVEAAVFDEVRDRLVREVEAAVPLDAILLSLHGGMSVEGPAANDPEGEIATAVRAAAGGSAVIAVVMDLHSDTTDRLLEATDLTLAYNEEPHRDAYERGVEAAELALRARAGTIAPVSSRAHPPMLLPAINMATDEGPMHELHRLRVHLEAEPGVLDVSIHGGFYGSDQPEAGFSVVCTTDGDHELAERTAKRVASEAWRRREEFIVDLVPLDRAVSDALAAGGPVGLIDECDDPAGGGSCDSVAIVRAMLAGGVERGGMSTIFDAESARAMTAAGTSAELTLTLGAKADCLHGESLEVSGRVGHIHHGPLAVDNWSGRSFDFGAVGVLEVGGVQVVVTERRMVTENVDIFEALGLDVRQMQMAGFKGLGLHVRQALAGKIERYIPVDAGRRHPPRRAQARPLPAPAGPSTTCPSRHGLENRDPMSPFSGGVVVMRLPRMQFATDCGDVWLQAHRSGRVGCLFESLVEIRIKETSRSDI